MLLICTVFNFFHGISVTVDSMGHVSIVLCTIECDMIEGIRWPASAANVMKFFYFKFAYLDLYAYS